MIEFTPTDSTVGITLGRPTSTIWPVCRVQRRSLRPVPLSVKDGRIKRVSFRLISTEFVRVSATEWEARYFDCVVVGRGRTGWPVSEPGRLERIVVGLPIECISNSPRSVIKWQNETGENCVWDMQIWL